MVTTDRAKKEVRRSSSGKGASRELFKMPVGNAEEANAEMQWEFKGGLGVEDLENG